MKKLFYFLVLCFSIVFAQNEKFKETINTVTNLTITLPSEGAEIAGNQLAVNKYEVYLLDENFKQLNKEDYGKFEILRKPNDVELKKLTQGGHGTVIFGYIKAMFKKPGTYIIKSSYQGKAETGQASVDRFYKITVDYPTFASVKDLDSIYYIGERGLFSIAVNEFNDIRKYSYKVFEIDKNGTKIEMFSGSGPTIDMGEIIQLKNLNKTIQIEGYYDNNIYEYYNHNKIIKSSIWNFIVSPIPDLVEFNTWDDTEKENCVLDLATTTFFNPLTFYYMYAASKDVNFIAVTPECNDLVLDATPNNFLAGEPEVSTSGVFLTIKLNVNPKFISAIGSQRAQNVSLNIKFRTQFGDFEKTYKAKVFKSK
jgi:hypothetical protein